MELQKRFVYNLKKYRQKIGYSQEKLGKIAGLSRVYITQIESGVACNVGLRCIERLAFALEIDPIDLLIEHDFNYEK